MLQVREIEEPDDNGSSDSEIDSEEELEGSDEENLDENCSDSVDSDDAIVAQDAQRQKKRPRLESRSKFLFGKNRYKWSVDPPCPRSRTSTPSVPMEGPRGLGAGATVGSRVAAWSLLLPDEALQKIILHTNEAITRAESRYSSGSTFTHKIDLPELKAFIGLLYISGIQGSTRRNTKTLYGKLSSPVFRATMPRARFEFLLSVLRFDDKSTRHERRETDKLAPIRELWNTFIGNSKSNFDPGQNVTIDEQLLSFRGRCAFRVYIRNKPDKYGMKIVTMNDSETGYLIDAIPYVGRVAVNRGESIPTYYVLKLTESIVGSNRNITCDNWFTSIPLVETLRNESSLTLVGTIRKDKREIPEAMKTISEIHGSKFAYANKSTLVSYCPKKNKVVFLISSLHNAGKISSDRQKPEIILYYNKTKGATDTFDQMCHEYTVARGTRRWPLRFFYGILDQASINAFILFSLNKDNNVDNRREFNENLALHLLTPFLTNRLRISTLRLQVRGSIESILGIDHTMNPIDDATDFTLDKQKRCAFCPRNNDKKTKYICSKCRYPRCQEHRSMQCTQCAPN